MIDVLFSILISTGNKALRKLVRGSILSDLRNANAKTKTHALNRTLQTILYNLLTSDRSSNKAKEAVRITRALWRRRILDDAKSVEIMKEAALADNEQVSLRGVKFFLGEDREQANDVEDESSDEEPLDMRRLRHQAGINKKSKKRDNKLRQAASTVQKHLRKINQSPPLNFPALHLLHDPQTFAETLFSRHLQSGKSRLNLDGKLVVLQLLTRLVGLHQLIILPLYSYFSKYLIPRQVNVTSFLASLAQATHKLVPPDALEPLNQKIANEFVSDAASGAVCAVGLNAIREICARQPLCISDTLLQDLVMYRKSRDKGAAAAAKGLMSLFQKVGPGKLRRRDRGRDAAMALRAGGVNEERYGHVPAGGIEGLQLLEKWKEEEKTKGAGPGDSSAGGRLGLGEEVEEDEGAWEVDGDSDSSDSGGWIDVESDSDPAEAAGSDGLEEKSAAPPTKKLKVDEEGEKSSSSDGLAITSQADIEVHQDLNLSNLATTTILTPADLTKLNELRQSAAVKSLLPGQQKHNRKQRLEPDIMESTSGLTAENIEAAAKLGHRVSKEEKLSSARGNRDQEEQKDKHRSSKVRKKERMREEGKSSTNREKAKKKNALMMSLGRAQRKRKEGSKRGLREVGRELRMKQQKGHLGGKRPSKKKR